MKINGESIYATTASPFEKLDWGRCTQKKLPVGKTRLYLHVFDWPKDGRLVVPLAAVPRAHARFLGGKSLELRPEGTQTTITVGSTPQDPIASVIQLDIDGTPAVR